MQVSEHEAEERELVDRVVDLDAVHKGVDDPCGPEPPPELVGVPTVCRYVSRTVEALYSEPVVEALRPDGVRVHELEHALEVRDDDQQKAGPYAGKDRSIKGSSVEAHHACHQRQHGCGCHRRYQRERQVVGEVGGYARQLGDDAHHPVAEVVVADGLASQPRVFRLAGSRFQRCVEEREVHRLLGVVYRRVVGAEEYPAQEEDQEYDLGDRNQPPPSFQERGHLFTVEIQQHSRRGRYQEHQPEQSCPDAGEQVQHAQDPGDVADQQDSEGFAQPVSPVRQLGQQEVGEWEDRQPDDLYSYQPEENVQHSQTPLYGRWLVGTNPTDRWARFHPHPSPLPRIKYGAGSEGEGVCRLISVLTRDAPCQPLDSRFRGNDGDVCW